MQLSAQHSKALPILLLASFSFYLIGSWLAYTATFDTGTVGLMAVNIVQGDRPLFFYGQYYMGALEAYVAAIMVAIFGFSELAVSLSPILFAVLWIFASYLLFKEIKDHHTGLIAALCTACSGYYVFYYSISPYGGYPVIFALGTLVLWLTTRLFQKGTTRWATLSILLAIGVLSGLGLWTHPLILPYLLTSLVLLFIYLIRNISSALVAGYILSCSIAALGLLPYLLASTGTYDGTATAQFIYSVSQCTASFKNLWLTNIRQLLFWEVQGNTIELTAMKAVRYLVIGSTGIITCLAMLTLIKETRKSRNYFLLVPILFLIFYLACFLPHQMALINAPRYAINFWVIFTSTAWAYALILDLPHHFRLVLRYLFCAWIAFQLTGTVLFIHNQAANKHLRETSFAIIEKAKEKQVETVWLIGKGSFGLRGQLLSMFAENRIKFVNTGDERYPANAQFAETSSNYALLCLDRLGQTIESELESLNISYDKDTISRYQLYTNLQTDISTSRLVPAEKITLAANDTPAKGSVLNDRTFNTVVHWQQPEGKQIEVDLGTVRKINKVWLFFPERWKQCQRTKATEQFSIKPPHSYSIETSINGVDFRPVQKTTARLGNGYSIHNHIYLNGYYGKLEHRFAAVTTQYIRIIFHSTSPLTLDELYVFEEQPLAKAQPAEEVSQLAELLADNDITFTLADRWLSAQLLQSIPHSDNRPPALPRLNPRHDKRNISRLLIPGQSLAVAASREVADACADLIKKHYGEDAITKRYDLVLYSLFILNNKSLESQLARPLLWNGHTVTRVMPQNRHCFVPELSAAGQPYFSPTTVAAKGFYHDRWTNGDAALQSINYALSADERYLILHTYGWLPLENDPREINLQVVVNNSTALNYAFRKGYSFYYYLEASLKRINSIALKSNTFSPGTTDIRSLGIDISYIEIR